MVMAERSEGTFEPAPESECDQKAWFSNATDLYGHPIANVRQRHSTWKRGGELQKFFQALEVDLDREHTMHAPEIDCNHAMCHVHPNGHQPPSGEQKALIKIMDLFDVEDVRLARELASGVLENTIINVLINGGEWNERTVSEGATRSANEAQISARQLQH
jgi:hypothetical protein